MVEVRWKTYTESGDPAGKTHKGIVVSWLTEHNTYGAHAVILENGQFTQVRASLLEFVRWVD